MDKIGNEKVNNLLYINDLKSYTKDDIQIEGCKAMIQEFSTDIMMIFGLDKIAVIHMQKKVADSSTVKIIPLLTRDENYKYLGILQAEKILHNQVKDNVKRKYIGRVRLILRK